MALALFLPPSAHAIRVFFDYWVFHALGSGPYVEIATSFDPASMNGIPADSLITFAGELTIVFSQGGTVRDFDQELEQDLSFKIRGETFKMRYVRPEILQSWESENIEGAAEADALKILDERIVFFLDQNGDSSARWEALRKRDDDPVTLGQLTELVTWMVEVQSGRPTTAPSPSASGRGRTAASSKAG